MNKNPPTASSIAQSAGPAGPDPLRAWCWRLCLLLLALAAQLWPARAAAGGIEVIVSPEQGSVAIDRGMLRAIFTTRLRQWPDGTPIHVFVLPDDNAVHDQFCREQLGMYPYVLRELWDRLLYTGTGLTPTVVRSEAEMRERVRGTPGAIGYLSIAAAAVPGRGAENFHPSPARAAMVAFVKDWP